MIIIMVVLGVFPTSSFLSPAIFDVHPTYPPTVNTTAYNKTVGDSSETEKFSADHTSENSIFFNWLKSQITRVKRQASQQTQHSTAEPLRLGSVPRLLDAERRDGTTQIALKKKILKMMLQSMYSAQERLWPLEPIVKKYEGMTPYRMAFIFMKLDQLIYESHALSMYLERTLTDNTISLTSRLQLYSQVMRRNIDVTYMADYISERVPQDQVVRIRSYMIRQEQEQLVKKRVQMDQTTLAAHVQRPQLYYNDGPRIDKLIDFPPRPHWN